MKLSPRPASSAPPTEICGVAIWENWPCGPIFPNATTHQFLLDTPLARDQGKDPTTPSRVLASIVDLKAVVVSVVIRTVSFDVCFKVLLLHRAHTVFGLAYFVNARGALARCHRVVAPSPTRHAHWAKLRDTGEDPKLGPFATLEKGALIIVTTGQATGRLHVRSLRHDWCRPPVVRPRVERSPAWAMMQSCSDRCLCSGRRARVPS